MFSIDESIIAVFCCVSDLLKEITQKKGFAPALANRQVLTWVKLLKRMRRLIETMIGQLVEHFSIEPLH